MSNSATNTQKSSASSDPNPLSPLFDLNKAEDKIREARNQNAALRARIMAVTYRKGKAASLEETAKANEELEKLLKMSADLLQLAEDMAEEIEAVLRKARN